MQLADIIIVGGGLSGSLLAWRLKEKHPSITVRLIEAEHCLGGNHTWSFFETDLSAEQNRWIEPFLVYRWPGYEVHFPRGPRRLTTAYCSITSERLHERVAHRLASAVTLGVAVAEVTPHQVRLASGETLKAACVIDARGPRENRHLVLGFQKFLGLEVRLAKPHGRVVPIIMDATVSQDDGYRFVYTLPLDEHRLLIEDTYYSDDQSLSVAVLRQRIAAYAQARQWEIAEVLREEIGVLPIILAGDHDKLLAGDSLTAPRIGLGAALFHPTTGYSLPDAVRLSDLLADSGAIASTASARAVITAYCRQVWRQRFYFRLLNRMLFRAARPDERYKVLQRFYGFDQELIQRFYAAQPSMADQVRILLGKPPVPILSALGCVSERRMMERCVIEQSKDR